MAALHLAAFGEHGAVVNAIVHDVRPTIPDLGGCSFVAEDGGGVLVGHAMFTTSILDAPARLVPAPC
ncbi:hypothetical protein [Agromyces sp. Marseille-Q5079]|uniref:hypothetical protein n=1 Tax=Agromyces sp. Marseille-Q5079 TaxID=3439059 RepID=UPI003D9CA814